MYPWCLSTTGRCRARSCAVNLEDAGLANKFPKILCFAASGSPRRRPARQCAAGVSPLAQFAPFATAASAGRTDQRTAAFAWMRSSPPTRTELVLSAAHELGLDPIVHVSSYVALLPSVEPLTPSSGIGEPSGAYPQSKAESERIARKLQDAGAPVTIVHPGMVWGPHDPNMGESASMARAIVSNRAPVGVVGGMPIADVRDLAAVHAAVIEPRRGPRRYLATGEFLTFADIVDALRAATGRRLPMMTAPARLALAAATGADAIQRVLPFRVPIGFQGTWTAVNGVPGDVTATREELASRSGRAPKRSPTPSDGSTKRATSARARPDGRRPALDPHARSSISFDRTPDTGAPPTAPTESRLPLVLGDRASARAQTPCLEMTGARPFRTLRAPSPARLPSRGSDTVSPNPRPSRCALLTFPSAPMPSAPIRERPPRLQRAAVPRSPVSASRLAGACD